MFDQPAAHEIAYVFHLGDDRSETVRLTFDGGTYLMHIDRDAPAPAWTRLDAYRCRNCPLTIEDGAACPFARALDGFITRFDAFYSYETAVVEVMTAARTVVAKRPLHQVMASLVGLIGATSGCPHLAFFRPMARFHLPLADEQETLVRTFSLYLLGEYLRSGATGTVGMSVEGLQAHYREVFHVNQGMAERIRAAFAKDAVINGIVILDTFAQAVPFVVDEAFAELRPLFNF